MEILLWTGSLAGGILGLVHGAYLYRKMVAIGPRETPSVAKRHLRAFYYAVATLILWILLGTYVLVLWALSLIPYAAKQVIRP